METFTAAVDAVHMKALCLRVIPECLLVKTMATSEGALHSKEPHGESPSQSDL